MFSISTIEHQGRPTAALCLAGGYLPLRDTSVIELLQDWDRACPELQRRAAAGVAECDMIPRADATVLTPLRHPGKIIGIAFNYRSALLEAGMPPVAWKPLPLFVRPATNTLVGPRDVVHMPVGEALDWEVELGAVIGARMRNVSAAEGARGIAAYAVCVDLTVRDLLAVDTPFKMDFFRSKCQDGLSPIGGWITPAVFVPDPYDLRLRLSVNGVVKQDESSSDMLVPIGDLVSEVSRYVTLEPGDLLLTGTPAGVGRFKGPYLRPGDRVCAQIEGLGACEFKVLPRP